MRGQSYSQPFCHQQKELHILDMILSKGKDKGKGKDTDKSKGKGLYVVFHTAQLGLEA